MYTYTNEYIHIYTYMFVYVCVYIYVYVYPCNPKLVLVEVHAMTIYQKEGVGSYFHKHRPKGVIGTVASYFHEEGSSSWTHGKLRRSLDKDGA